MNLSRKHRYVIIACILISVMAAAFVTHRYFIDWWYRLTSYPSQAAYAVSSRTRNFFDAWNAVKGVNELQEQVSIAKADNRRLESENDRLKRENDLLRKQLGIQRGSERQLFFARIISVQRNSITSTLLLDKGAEDGIEKKQIVIASGDVLVGTVVEVFPHTSRVLILDDPKQIVSVRIGHASLIAESRGLLSNKITLNLISHTDAISLGSSITTSGLDGFPEGLIVGTIGTVGVNGDSLFQNVTGTISFDIRQNTQLFILR